MNPPIVGQSGLQEGKVEDPSPRVIRRSSRSKATTLEHQTPIKKRKSKGEVATSSKKPRRSSAQLLSEHESHDTLIPGGNPLSHGSRPAGPHTTYVPLITPRGSRILKHAVNAPVPISLQGRQISTSTATILDEACAHLINVEPKLKVLIQLYPCQVFSPRGLAEDCKPFRSLVSGIMAQQVSGAAASSIKKKFLGLFPDLNSIGGPDDEKAFPLPEHVAACDIPFLRQAGLSERKAEYIQGLAQKFATGELSTSMLLNASDDEIIEKLTAVRGLGRWSVEMFACFGLKRLDIFSTGDLGVQRGMAAFLGKDVKKLKAKGGKWKYMSEPDMIDYAAKFAPYRSLFMWYMWRVEGVDIDAVEKA